MDNALIDAAVTVAIPLLALYISLIPMAILEWLEEHPHRGRRRRR